MYIDNTYISSLDELKEIIESHTRNGKVDDKFRLEFIETFEDNTETGLLAFAESIETKEAKKYAEHLAAQEAKWDSLSASEQYNSLVSFFNIVPDWINIMKYIEILNVDIRENVRFANVSIDVKVVVPVNENLQFEIRLFDEYNNVCRNIWLSKVSLTVASNTILHIEHKIDINESIDRIGIILQNNIINERTINRVRSFSVNGVNFKMIFVKRGELMPKSRETLSSFYIAETPVTQALWDAVLDDNSIAREMKDYIALKVLLKGFNIKFDMDKLLLLYPKVNISWEDCIKFIDKLNEKLSKEIQDAYFDFPTEEQWVYAARGGVYNCQHKYSGSDNIDDVAWYGGNSENKAHPVMSKKANVLGIYGMSGNVWELCKDNYQNHVIRGGSWYSYADNCCITYSHEFNFANDHTGLRLVLCTK